MPPFSVSKATVLLSTSSVALLLLVSAAWAAFQLPLSSRASFKQATDYAEMELPIDIEMLPSDYPGSQTYMQSLLVFATYRPVVLTRRGHQAVSFVICSLCLLLVLKDPMNRQALRCQPPLCSIGTSQPQTTTSPRPLGPQPHHSKCHSPFAIFAAFSFGPSACKAAGSTNSVDCTIFPPSSSI